MPIDQLSPELSDLLQASTDGALKGVHVALPGSVQRYDPATQKVDVLPLIGGAYFNEDNERVPEQLPVIPSCPVVFPGGGGMRLTFPIAVGDYGLLVFCSSAISRWLGSNGTQIDPGDDRKHHLNDAVFFPGGPRPFAKALADAPTDAASLGVDGGVSVDVTTTEVHAGGTDRLVLNTLLLTGIANAAATLAATVLTTPVNAGGVAALNALSAALSGAGSAGTVVTKGA